MDIGYELCQLLQTFGFGTVGADIFIGQIPDNTNGIYIIRTGGSLNMYNSLQETVLDIYVKDIRADTAIDKLERIKSAIHRHHSAESNNAYIYSILVIGDVEDVDRDLEHTKIFKITVSVINRDVAIIS
jgi:hypothetical protein